MSHYTNNLFEPTSKNNPWVHLFELIPKGARVLDVGCSSGNFGAVLIHEKRCKVVGLDIDKQDIKKAQANLSAAHVRNIETDDIADLGLFDVVVFADVLEHLMNPVAALEKVKTVLKKGGRIAFSIPNMAHISIRLQLMEGFFEYTPIGVLDRTHLHYYDELEVKHIFAEAALRIDHINPVTWTYPESVLSERLLRMGLAIHDLAALQQKLAKTKAEVWQFVGYAKPTTEKLSLRTKLQYGNPPEELSTALRARDAELQIIGKQLRRLERENQRLVEFYNNPFKGGVKRIIRKAHDSVKRQNDQ